MSTSITFTRKRTSLTMKMTSTRETTTTTTTPPTSFILITKSVVINVHKSDTLIASVSGGAIFFFIISPVAYMLGIKYRNINRVNSTDNGVIEMGVRATT